MEARLLDERREGIAEGKEIGLAEGEAIGLVKGEAEHKLKVAKLMLAKGCYSLQEITELSGLSLADVEKLKEEALAISCTERPMLKRRLAAMLAFASPSAMTSRLLSNKRASISINSRLTFVSNLRWLISSSICLVKSVLEWLSFFFQLFHISER